MWVVLLYHEFAGCGRIRSLNAYKIDALGCVFEVNVSCWRVYLLTGNNLSHDVDELDCQDVRSGNAHLIVGGIGV